jgi:Family of unknown function (DUF695)
MTKQRSIRSRMKELDSLEVDGLAVHVAAATKGGIKDLLFYTRNAEESLARAEPFRTRYPQFNVSCEVSHDPKWTHYEEFL